MKKYIILTNDIFQVGGGQIYVCKKCEYLRKKGFEPIVVYYDKSRGSRVYIEDLIQFKSNRIKYCKKPLTLSSKRDKRLAIKTIKTIIGAFDSVIFESNTIVSAPWCELFAQVFKGKHICICLNESFKGVDRRLYPFFNLLHENSLLYGTGEQSLNLLFEELGQPLKTSDNSSYFDILYGEVLGADKPIFWNTSFDFVIGIYGRLDKHFVIESFVELKEYAKKNTDKTFLILSVGGSDRKKELKPFFNLVKKQKNLSFFCTGPCFPTPRNWLKSCDVVLATAGSAVEADRANCITISFCVQNDKPFGIYNYTTTKDRDCDCTDSFDKNLSDFLDLILKEGIVQNLNRLRATKPIDNLALENSYYDQIEIISNAKPRSYFDFETIKFSWRQSVKYAIYSNYFLRMFWHKLRLRRIK